MLKLKVMLPDDTESHSQITLPIVPNVRFLVQVLDKLGEVKTDEDSNDLCTITYHQESTTITTYSADTIGGYLIHDINATDYPQDLIRQAANLKRMGYQITMPQPKPKPQGRAYQIVSKAPITEEREPPPPPKKEEVQEWTGCGKEIFAEFTKAQKALFWEGRADAEEHHNGARRAWNSDRSKGDYWQEKMPRRPPNYLPAKEVRDISLHQYTPQKRDYPYIVGYQTYFCDRLSADPKGYVRFEGAPSDLESSATKGGLPPALVVRKLKLINGEPLPFYPPEVPMEIGIVYELETAFGIRYTTPVKEFSMIFWNHDSPCVWPAGQDFVKLFGIRSIGVRILPKQSDQDRFSIPIHFYDEANGFDRLSEEQKLQANAFYLAAKSIPTIQPYPDNSIQQGGYRAAYAERLTTQANPVAVGTNNKERTLSDGVIIDKEGLLADTNYQFTARYANHNLRWWAPVNITSGIVVGYEGIHNYFENIKMEITS